MSKKDIERYRERLACKMIAGIEVKGFNQDFDGSEVLGRTVGRDEMNQAVGFKRGFDAALELSKAVGRAEAYERAREEILFSWDSKPNSFRGLNLAFKEVAHKMIDLETAERERIEKMLKGSE